MTLLRSFYLKWKLVENRPLLQIFPKDNLKATQICLAEAALRYS